jgi:von Willebrand factor type A domain
MFLTKRLFALAALAALATGVALPVRADEPKPAAPAAPAEPVQGRAIDLVICLDVSGSMDGLIESAKIQLWNVVNDLARIKPTPNLRVGLYSYGATRFDAKKGWVNKEVDLTDDLDEVYKALNGLRTGGGDELVARVTKAALDEQKWSTEKGALKLVFVCGNEPVNQDKTVNLSDVAEQAKKAGVLVNTVYCKWGHDQEIAPWAEFAASCKGKQVVIDQNRAAKEVIVKTEFDDQIIKLGEELNKTYVAYGKDGVNKALNQLKQDQNAADLKPAAPGAGAGAAIARAESKASELYKNAGWDLIDRMKEKDFDLKKLKDEDLPKELKELKPEEREAYLKKKATERDELKKKIADLSAQRAKKVAEEKAKQPKNEQEKALDEALKSIIQEQVKK